VRHEDDMGCSPVGKNRSDRTPTQQDWRQWMHRVSRARYGEHWHLYEPLIHGGHHKLEVIVEDEQVEKVVKEISKSGSTGRAGDGMLSVFDLQSVVSLKGSTGTEIKDHGTL
jgi:NADH:ubiquinone oxidoreductase subunit F (NADH-binding)